MLRAETEPRGGQFSAATRCDLFFELLILFPPLFEIPMFRPACLLLVPFLAIHAEVGSSIEAFTGYGVDFAVPRSHHPANGLDGLAASGAGAPPRSTFVTAQGQDRGTAGGSRGKRATGE